MNHLKTMAYLALAYISKSEARVVAKTLGLDLDEYGVDQICSILANRVVGGYFTLDDLKRAIHLLSVKA